MENTGSDEWMSLPANEQQLEELYLQGKRHPAMKVAYTATKMKRSPNKVFILLVGLSGAGKSSTVDYLFGTNIAEKKKSRAVLCSTIEYTVKLKSAELRIPDLQLSIIDTPGFSDADDLEQEAKNILSTKYFLQSNPYIKNRYPNLIMIILSIHDNRIAGQNSNFAKMLRGINNINAIDCSNPNVVVVLTHAMSIARNPKIWEEKVEMKKAEIQAIVQFYVGINPEIVVQENQPEDNDLEPNGDWYLLPNGDKQPKILYQACERILGRTKDEIGQEAVAVCFEPGIDKSVMTGQVVQSSEVNLEDTQAMLKSLLNSEDIVSTSEVGSMLENYKKQKIAKELVNDIFILQVKFRDLGISKMCDLQSMSMNTLVTKMYPARMTKGMQKVVEDLFSSSYEQIAGSNYHMGIEEPLNQFNSTDTPASGHSSHEESFEMLHGTAYLIGSLSCFHEDSLVMLHNQKQKRMKDLSVGDKILTANSDGRLSQDEVIAWLHQVRDCQFTFLQIVHDLGEITLTPEHIIFVGKNRRPKHASTLRPGDQLIFFTNDNNSHLVTVAKVVSIHKVKRMGIYTPLTYSGSLLVDKVDVSCYCTINPLQAFGKEIISSHTLAHAGFLPLRIAFKFGFNISKSYLEDETGIHYYALWLIKCVLGKQLKSIEEKDCSYTN